MMQRKTVKASNLYSIVSCQRLAHVFIMQSTEANVFPRHKRVAIFTKACFGHPNPSKRKNYATVKLLRKPRTSCFTGDIPNKGYVASLSQ